MESEAVREALADLFARSSDELLARVVETVNAVRECIEEHLVEQFQQEIEQELG